MDFPTKIVNGQCILDFEALLRPGFQSNPDLTVSEEHYADYQQFRKKMRAAYTQSGTSSNVFIPNYQRQYEARRVARKDPIAMRLQETPKRVAKDPDRVPDNLAAEGNSKAPKPCCSLQ